MRTIKRPTWLIEDDRAFNSSEDPVFTSLHKIYADVIYGEVSKETRSLEKLSRLPKENEKIILYGSQPFINSCNFQHPNLNPGSSWSHSHNFQCTRYYDKYKNYMLNSDFYTCSFGDFCNEFHRIFESFQEDRLFLRPDNYYKYFNGQIIYEKDLITGDWHKRLAPNIGKNEILFIAPPKEIIREFRFFLAKDYVISGSQYKNNGEYSLSSGIPSEALTLAITVANQKWLPAPIFAVDIALLSNGDFKVVELNPFNSSSFYCCDIVKIFQHAEFIAANNVN